MTSTSLSDSSSMLSLAMSQSSGLSTATQVSGQVGVGVLRDAVDPLLGFAHAQVNGYSNGHAHAHGHGHDVAMSNPMMAGQHTLHPAHPVHGVAHLGDGGQIHAPHAMMAWGHGEEDGEGEYDTSFTMPDAVSLAVPGERLIHLNRCQRNLTDEQLTCSRTTTCPNVCPSTPPPSSPPPPRTTPNHPLPSLSIQAPRRLPKSDLPALPFKSTAWHYIPPFSYLRKRTTPK